MSDTIVCMVRSGGGGRAAQDRAVEIALGCSCRLIFLNVVDTHKVKLADDDQCNAAREEMAWIGNMTLSLVHKQALMEGVEAEKEIRFGSVYEEVVAFLEEVNADLLLVGSPDPRVSQYETRLAQVHNFAELVTQETGVQVDVLGGDLPAQSGIMGDISP